MATTMDVHPLAYPWTFTYFKKVANKSYEENTFTLGTTETVEDFWRLYVHLRRPVDERPTVCDYHVFREGIRPMWEDDANKGGGKWTLRMRKTGASAVWEELVLAIVGEALDAAADVCGASLSVCNLVHLWMVSCLPTARRKLADMCTECFVPPSETDFSIPYTPEEAAARLKQMFHNIGVRQHFAPLVTALAHGSRSVNNPFDSAHNCGACGGREGGANARMFARCANDRAIRQALDEKFGIVIHTVVDYRSYVHALASQPGFQIKLTELN
jgi:translation initiation factor 4E